MSDVEDDDIPSDEEQQELAEPVNCPLTLDVVRGGLSVLSRTPSSIEHVYARLDVRDKTLSDIAVLSNYAHLRFIDISHNRVDDLSPLNACEMLCTLDASNNQISHFRLTTHRYLQQLDLSQNKFDAIPALDQPMLKVLNLASNSIQSAEALNADLLPSLESLILDHNELVTMVMSTFNTLTWLSASHNKLTDLKGLSVHPNLKNVVLRENIITSLDEKCDRVRYHIALQVDLTGNKIEKLDEAKRISSLQRLRILHLAENAVAEESSYRQEMLVSCPDLESLDDIECEPEEKADAAALRRQRTSATSE